MSSLEDILREHGLTHLAPVLRAAAIDLDIAAEVSDEDLQSLSISLGDRKRLLRALSQAVAPSVQAEGERRVLTTVFVDLAGFTQLSTSVDPEVLQGAVAAYHRLATGVLAQWEGAVAQYLGDGILAYFGYPRAHEDDAERAVQAAVAIVQGTERLEAAGRRLRARAGIATGLVVIGKVIGGELVSGSVAVGEAPNRAARLQGYGAPGEVVLDAATQRLLSRSMQLVELGPASFKGFEQPLACWRVDGVAPGQSRFRQDTLRSDLIGREAEMSELHRAWQRACEGAGGTVLVRGEAGIGKSRLVAELVAQTPGDGAAVLMLQCSAHHVATDHYPLRQALQREAAPVADGVRADDRLVGWVTDLTGEADATAREHAKALTPWLEVNDGEPVTPHELRTRLVETLRAAALKRPVLVVLEDLHWTDPSTAEWWRAAASASHSCRMLLVATSRLDDDLVRLKADSHIEVNQLAPERAEALAHRAAQGRRLPRQVLTSILQRAGGVPLYVEEITRAVIEADADAGSSGVEVPETLQASLLARFDRLGPAREVAQLASVIGRSFDSQLLASLANTPREDVLLSLQRIAAAGMMIAPAPGSTSEWSFKHALIQESAYSTLLHSVRRQLHSRVADLLPVQRMHDPGVLEAIAWHLTAAGRDSEAIAAWNAAAESAVKRRAAGAQHHYEQALALVRSQPEGVLRDAQELAQLLKLGPVVMMTKGVGAQGSVEIYERARELSLRVGSTSQGFLVAFGLWYSYEHQGRTAQQAAMLESMRGMARASGDVREQLQVHHAEWETCLNRTQFTETIAAANAGLALYDRRDRPLYLENYGGHDPAVCALSYRAAAEWSLGQGVQAFRSFEAALAGAAESGDMGTRVIATITFGGVCFVAREPERILSVCPPLVEACRRAGYASGILLLGIGWAAAMTRQPCDLVTMRRMVEGLRRSGVRIRLAYYEILLADTLRLHGEIDEAMEHVAAARACSSAHSDDTVLCKIHEVEGALHLQRGDELQALRSWREMLAAARRQRAIFLEIDAALRLAQLEEQHAGVGEATALLNSLLMQVSPDEHGAILLQARSFMASAGQPV